MGWPKCAAITYNCVSGGKWKWTLQWDPYWAGKCMQWDSNPGCVGFLGDWERKLPTSSLLPVYLWGADIAPGSPLEHSTDVCLFTALLEKNLRYSIFFHSGVRIVYSLLVFGSSGGSHVWYKALWCQQQHGKERASRVFCGVGGPQFTSCIALSSCSYLRNHLCGSAMRQIDKNPIFLDI